MAAQAEPAAAQEVSAAAVPEPRRGAATPGRGAAALALLLLVVGVAALEAGVALRSRGLSESDVGAACAAVRRDFQPGDLIAFAPAWTSQLVQRELGDLMPPTMLGRADARRYRRIFTLTLESAGTAALAEDVGGLSPVEQRSFGAITVSRYQQQPVAVTYDLTDRLLTAQVAQAPGAATAAAPPPGGEVPCLWSGALPTPLPARGPAGAFRCPGAAVERRVMEINYRPRYGVVASVAQGQRTILEYRDIADSDWQGGRLTLWLGLHDYYARKTAVGPAQVVVDLDQGARRVPLTVAVAQDFTRHELELPPGSRPSHVIRIEVSAASPVNHLVGLHGELRR